MISVHFFNFKISTLNTKEETEQSGKNPEITNETQDSVRVAMVEYLNDPLEKDEKILIYGKNAVEEEHPTAEYYSNLLREIKNPNAKNKNALHSRIKIEEEKVSKIQGEIRNYLNQTKIQPVLDALKIISEKANSENGITSKITSYWSLLLELSEEPIYKDQISPILIKIIKNIEEFQGEPQEILDILSSKENELTDTQISKITPSKITDKNINVLITKLPQLLSSPDTYYMFCDPKIITSNFDVHILLPIYLQMADVDELIYNFAIELSKGAPLTYITCAIRNLLSPKFLIRSCALDCIAASNIQREEVTDKLFCLLFLQGGSNKSTIPLIKRLKLKKPTSQQIYAMYNELFMLTNKDETLIEDIGRSFAVLMSNQDQDEVFNYLLDIYDKNSENNLLDDEKQFQNSVRASISFAFLQFKPLTENSLGFIMTTGLKDTHDVVRKNMHDLIEFYIKNLEYDDKVDLYQKMYSILNLPTVDIDESSKLRLELIDLCGKIAIEDENLAYEFIFCLMTKCINTSNIDLKLQSAKTISLIAKKHISIFDLYFPQILQIIPDLKTRDKLEGYAYSYTALLHSIGISSFNSRQVFEFTASLSNAVDPNMREFATYVFSALSNQFKALIEPSLPKILPDLFKLIGDSKVNVREAADKALNSLTLNLTKACVERALPSALEFVANDDSWRSQDSAVKFVTNLFKNQTKSMQKYTNQIVSALTKALKSPNGDVKKDAAETLECIKSLITNKTVLSLFQVLIDAITNQSKLDTAIESLSHMNLTTKLDSDSLSIIIPVLVVGCRSSNNNTKTSSIKIMGNLTQICVDNSLKYFSDDLVEPLFTLISDPSPSIRALASSSLSSLIVKLNPSVYDNVMERLISQMISKNSFAERQGFAMSIASLIKTRGKEELNAQLLDFIEKARNDQNIQIRECYVSLLGFLSHFFGAEDFHGCYDITIDAVLEACADSNDVIRTVGLRSVSLIAKTFAQTNPDLIITPFNNCALKDNWRYRQCAVQFMKAFVNACVGTTDADERGIRNIGELLEKIKQALKPDICSQSLTTLFILCSDPVQAVKQDALQVWRQIVPNTGGFVRDNIDVFVDNVSLFLTSDREVVRTVGAFAVKEGVSKVKTKLLLKMLDKLEELSKMEDIDIQHGALLCVHALDEEMDFEQKLRCCTIIAPFLSSPYEMLRTESLETFKDFKKTLGEDGTQSISSQLIEFVHNQAIQDKDISELKGLINVLDKKALNQLISKILSKPITEYSAKVAGKVVQVAEDALDSNFSVFADKVISLAVEDVDAVNVAKEIVKSVNNNHRLLFVQKFVQSLRSPQPEERNPSINVLRSVIDLNPDEEIIKNIIRSVLYVFDDPLDNLMDMSIDVIKAIVNNADEKSMNFVVFELADTFEQIGTTTKMRAFEQKAAFESFEPLIERCLLSESEAAIMDAGRLLFVVIPQLKQIPTTTKKLIARVIFAMQRTVRSDIAFILLKASRVLFEICRDENDVLPNSLPPMFIRFFKENDIALHEASADALCSLCSKLKSPEIIIRVLLFVLRMQTNTISSIIVKALIKIAAKYKIEDSKEIISVLEPHAKSSNRVQIRQLCSQAIAASLMSSGKEALMAFVPKMNIDNQTERYMTATIITEIMEKGNKSLVDVVLPTAISMLDNLEKETNSEILLILPQMVVSIIVLMPQLISELLSYIFGIINRGDAEHQVAAIQSLQQLANLQKSVFKSVQKELLDLLLDQYRRSDQAVKSAASASLFVLFRLEELSPEETSELAHLAGDIEQTHRDFKAIIQQSQTDRANQKIRR